MGCIIPGVPLEFAASEDSLDLYSITLPKATPTAVSSSSECPEVYVATFQAISLDGDADFSISFSSTKIDATQETPAADINMFNAGSDRVTLAICLSSEKETVLYASVASYQFSSASTWHVRVIFTPSASFYRIGLRELPFHLYNEFMLCK